MRTIPTCRGCWLPLLILVGLTVAGSVAASVGSIYYGQCDEVCWISKIEMDGSESAPYDFTARNAPAVDYLERKMYYRHGRWDSGQQQAVYSLRRSDLDGSNEELVLDYVYPSVTAVDPFAEKAYWSGERKIYRVNFDGSDPEVIVDLGLIFRDIAVDPGAGKIYWCQSPYSGGEPAEDWILRANLDGTEIESVIAVDDIGPSSIRGIAIDALGGHLFWTNSSPHVIRRASLDGSGIVNLIGADSLPDPSGVPVDIEVAGNSLVFTWSGSIYGADLNGSQVWQITGPFSSGAYDLVTDVPPDATVIPAVSSAGAVVVAMVLLLLSTMILLRRG